MIDRITSVAIVLLVMVLMSVICSCGTSKKTKSVNRQQKMESILHKTEAMSVLRGFESMEKDNSLTTVKLTHVVYDTASDTPRVQSRTEYECVKKADVTKSVTGEEEVGKEERSYEQTALSDTIAISESSVKEESTLPKRINHGLWIILLLVIVIFLWSVTAKKRRYEDNDK